MIWLAMALSAAVVMGFGAGPAAADHTSEVTGVNGLAFNYYTDVSLFQGPSSRRGYLQTECTATSPPFSCVPADAAAAAASPSVTCPTGGGTARITDLDGAKAQYGPAPLFSGIWGNTSTSAPPSGPLTSSIDCVLGSSGQVTGSTAVTLLPQLSASFLSVGGVGPGPFYADDVESTCSAKADGTRTGSATVVNGTVETSYYTGDDPNTPLIEQEGDVKTSEPVPLNPPVDWFRDGTLDHVGDHYRVIFNEQIINPDGSITVNAAHMKLLGPTAIGDMYIGSSTCGVKRQAVPHPCPTAGNQTAIGPLGGTRQSAGAGPSGAAAGIVGFGLFDGGLSLPAWAAAFSQRRRRRLATDRPAGHRSPGPRQARQSGFTLVELLVVIVILGILSAVVVFAVRGAGDKGQKAAEQTDERTIRTALEVYCAQKGTYPQAEPSPPAPPPGKDPMQVLVDGKFLSDRSTYHRLYTGNGTSFGPPAVPAKGNCPGSSGLTMTNYKLEPTKTQTSTNPNCP